MVAIEVPEVNYTEYSNRQLVAIPLAVLVLALAIIGGWYLVTGAPANLGLEFTGGVELRIADDGGDVEQQIETAFERQPDSVRSIPADDVYVVTFRGGRRGSWRPGRRPVRTGRRGGAVHERDRSSVPSFASDTARTAVFGVALAFLGMSVLVFALFRTFVPSSLAVVASAFSDLMVPIAVMNLLGIQMTLGTIAALLMIIGYSVDSDILLNNNRTAPDRRLLRVGEPCDADRSDDDAHVDGGDDRHGCRRGAVRGRSPPEHRNHPLCRALC